MFSKSLPWAVMLLLALPAAVNAQTKTETNSSTPSTIALSAPTAQSAITAAELGGTKNVHRIDNLYFGGQFSSEDIATLQAKNIERVVTLRTDGDEQTARLNGMNRPPWKPLI